MAENAAVEAISWRQGENVELEIVDLADSGDGVGRAGDRVVFVPETAVGDRVLARLVRVKPRYATAKLRQVLVPSGDRVRPGCIVADKCGGCQWQHVAYAAQLRAKHRQVVQTLQRLGGFAEPPVAPVLPGEPFRYRNKATYPVRRSPEGTVRIGYYRKGSHKLVNANRCPIQDERLDPFLAELAGDLQSRGWSIYNEAEHRGTVRHVAVRVGRRTGEILLTLVATGDRLAGLAEQAGEWLARYPHLVGVCLNLNPQRTNAIFGSETRLVAGGDRLREQFAGLTFQLKAETFFQVNTEAAEQLLGAVRAFYFQKTATSAAVETLIDAYCGIGTFTLPLARYAERAVGIESQAEAVALARENARDNAIANVEFCLGTTEALLAQELKNANGDRALVLLDPPRGGCDRAVIEALLAYRPARIAYISCKVSTLARDLKGLCAGGAYRLEAVQPVDLFAQTPHVECVAFLARPEIGRDIDPKDDGN